MLHDMKNRSVVEGMLCKDKSVFLSAAILLNTLYLTNVHFDVMLLIFSCPRLAFLSTEKIISSLLSFLFMSFPCLICFTHLFYMFIFRALLIPCPLSFVSMLSLPPFSLFSSSPSLACIFFF